MTGGAAQLRRALLGVGLPGLIAVASAVAEAAPDWELHARGLGPVTVGMPMAEALRLAGVEFEWVGQPAFATGECSYFIGRHGGREFRVLVARGRLSRIEVVEPGFVTLSGVGVGTSTARLRAAYASRLVDEPDLHARQQNLRLLVAGPYRIGHEDYGVAFQVAPQTGVTGMRAARYGALRERDGCR